MGSEVNTKAFHLKKNNTGSSMDVELGADAADVFVQALTNNTSLITLKVKTKHGGRAEIDEASDKTVIKLIAHTLGQNPSVSVSSLSFRGSDLSDGTGQELMTTLSFAPQPINLTSLDLSGNRLSDRTARSLDRVLDGMCSVKLKVLDLSNNNLGDAGVSVMLPGLSDNKTLEVLNLDNNGITNRSMTYDKLPRSIFQCKSLKKISFARNTIQTPGAISLAEVLKLHPNCRYVDLSYNNLELFDMDRVQNMVDLNKKLEVFDISATPALAAPGSAFSGNLAQCKDSMMGVGAKAAAASKGIKGFVDPVMDQFKALAKKCAVDDHWARLTDLAKWALVVETTAVRDEQREMELGCSKMGGTPDLPFMSKVAEEYRDYHFVGQLDCAELSETRAAGDNGIPPEGVIQFYVDNANRTRTIYLNVHKSTLKRTAPAFRPMTGRAKVVEQRAKTVPCKMTFREVLVLPGMHSREFTESRLCHMLTGQGRLNSYKAICEEMAHAGGAAGDPSRTPHRLLGYQLPFAHAQPGEDVLFAVQSDPHVGIDAEQLCAPAGQPLVFGFTSEKFAEMQVERVKQEENLSRIAAFKKENYC